MRGIRHPYPGLYVAFEGIGCSGKSTQARILFDSLRDCLPANKLAFVREPGGTEIGRLIRGILLDENAPQCFL